MTISLTKENGEWSGNVLIDRGIYATDKNATGKTTYTLVDTLPVSIPPPKEKREKKDKPDPTPESIARARLKELEGILKEYRSNITTLQENKQSAILQHRQHFVRHNRQKRKHGFSPVTTSQTRDNLQTVILAMVTMIANAKSEYRELQAEKYSCELFLNSRKREKADDRKHQNRKATYQQYTYSR